MKFSKKDAPLALTSEMRGHTCVVTGSTSGIGLESATLLALKGCHVILAARSERKAKEVIEALTARYRGISLEFIPLELSSLRTVKQFAKTLSESKRTVDVLINNAGVWHKELILTEDNLESTFQVNYLGHFYLTELLLNNNVMNVEDGVIINIVSERLKDFEIDSAKMGSKNSGINWGSLLGGDKAYAESKLMQLMFTFELDREITRKGGKVACTALHPGGVSTGIYDELPFCIGKLIKACLPSPRHIAKTIVGIAMDSSRQGAQLVGTKVPKGIRDFAYSEDNQRQLWRESKKVLRRLDGIVAFHSINSHS